jgi:hypothetical protein
VGPKQLEGYNEIYCISFDGSDLDDLVSFGGNPQGKFEDRAILCSVHFKLRRHLYEVVGQYAGTDKIASICEVNVKACKANCG